MNAKQTYAARSSKKEKTLQLRKELWPEKENELWDRKKNQGFTTIPRTMPILMSIIDDLTKGKPAGQTYFALWCRAYDEHLLIIENAASFAAESGFTGERAETTWRQRMGTLQELGFIACKDGATGKFHYVLLLNPHLVAKKLKDRIQEGAFRQLFSRGLEVGAKDMTDDPVNITNQ